MKKFFIFLLSLTLAFTALGGCNSSKSDDTSSTSFVEESEEESTNSNESAEDEKDIYLVTFKQEGCDDIVKEVEKGKGLTDVPTPVQKTGYTIKWTIEDFSNITENLIVETVATANEYTITYDAGEGTVTPATQKVTYDAIPQSFATPTREAYNFVCWTYEGKAVQASGVWNIASDVTLVASWVEKEKRTVTFVQDGFKPIEIEVIDGEGLPGELIPDTQPKKGYTVVWEEKIPSTITENIIINAVATPNTYYIAYDAGEGDVDMALQDVVYDSVPGSFAIPTREGYKFKGWEYNGTVISASDLWKIDTNVTFTAKWAKIYTITLNANGGSLTGAQTITVVQGEAYSLPTPVREDYRFLGWKYGTQKVATNGTWTIDGITIVLKASWSSLEWTGNY